MARYVRSYRKYKKYHSNKKYKYYRKRRVGYKKKPRGMQKIKKVRWPARNIGGDRAYCKLRYVIGSDFTIAPTESYESVNVVYNIGADSTNPVVSGTIHDIFGDTPNLSTMGALYTNYRIRGIKLKLTYWQQSGSPVVLYTNAVTSQTGASTAPSPNFVVPNISVLPEQRWARYRVCGATAAGAKPTTLKAYYSVNKVYGPDAVVKNDADFIGKMSPAYPYWGTLETLPGPDRPFPLRTTWLQYGIFTLNGQPLANDDSVLGVLKVEATVYCEFFGKRVQTQ